MRLILSVIILLATLLPSASAETNFSDMSITELSDLKNQISYAKMLISNGSIVSSIEISSETNLISWLNVLPAPSDSGVREDNSQSNSAFEAVLLEKWGAENVHVLRAYAEMLSEPIYMWAPMDTLATHYALFDENSDGIPELVVFGVDPRYESAGFEVYQYSDAMVKRSSSAGRYYTYHTLSIYNGIDLYSNGDMTVSRTGIEEPLVRDYMIVGGIEIGSEHDSLRNLPALDACNDSDNTNTDSQEGQTTAPETASITQVNPAFDAAFTHTAGTIDKTLCLQSAYAAKKVYNQDNIVDFLIELGFDSSSIEQQDYISNAPHSVAITMANRVVKDENGKPITVYAVIVRGTVGTMEWISDFDIGNGDIALGFDKAASRVMDHFALYVKNNPPLEGGFADGKYKVWTCGHSRGAAVANLLAGKYLPQYLSCDNVYAYGFAVPYVDKNATRFSNIFNFNIAGDFIPYVPFNSWGFERYGLTIYNSNSEIEDVQVNTEANIRLMLSFLSDTVPTQKEFVSRTKEFLQILENDPLAQEANPEFMVKGLLSICTTAGTIPELAIKLDINEDLEFLANLIVPGILPDDFVYTTEDFFTTYNHIGASHSMDTYLLWIEDICAPEN